MTKKKGSKGCLLRQICSKRESYEFIPFAEVIRNPNLS